MRSAENDVREETVLRTGLPALALAGVLALIAGPATGCGGHGEEGRPRARAQEPLAVSVAAVEEVDWSDGFEVTAGVQPYLRATPSTVLMGRVDEILRQEGDRVRKGETLARIDSRDVAAKVAQAEAAVAAARAMEHNAQLMKERIERLHARDAASRRDLDDAIAGYEAAQANLSAAEEGVKAARVYLAYSDVTAPFDGFVSDRMVEVGDLAAPGRPLFVIEDLSRIKVEAQVPESEGAGLAEGRPVEVEIRGEVFPAKLTEVLPAADPHSRTFTVRAVMDNPDRRFRSGIFARLRLGGQSRRAVVAPENAVTRQGPLTGVFLVEDSVARLRWITLGGSRNGRVEVLTGLRPGERVVVDPPPALEDGRPVEVR